jgi:hypothetical protein
MTDIYLGHPRELVDLAVVIPSGHFVQLDDFLFELHGLGPRFARVQTQNYRGHRALSYAYLDMPGTTYDLISELDNPRDLGNHENLATDQDLVEHLTAIFVERSGHFPTQQQLSLALICARAEVVHASDELGMHRLAKWALIYEKRAHWMTKNRQLAYSLPSINWEAMKL